MSKVRLTEEQLHKVIKESVKRLLREDEMNGQMDPKEKREFDGYIASLKASGHAYVPEEELNDFSQYCESIGFNFSGGAQGIECRCIYI